MVYKQPRLSWIDDQGRYYLETVGLNETTKWKEGKCHLSVKKGKRRHLVKGVIVSKITDDPECGVFYHYYFVPRGVHVQS